MKTTLYCFCISVFSIILAYDIYFVYIHTHKINETLLHETNKLKTQSIIGSYIKTPTLKDPFETLHEILETFLDKIILFFLYFLINIIQTFKGYFHFICFIFIYFLL